MRSVGILIVGDEILKGEVREQNAVYLFERLRETTTRAVRQVVVPDAMEAIQEELPRLRARADAVVVSGGLGPTHDDVTRQAMARVLGVPLERHAAAAARIEAWYGDAVTEAELTMADLPRGATLLDGVRTNTFGIVAAGVYAFPGVPFLFRDLVDALVPCFDAVTLHRQEIVTARREGEIAEALAVAQGGAADVAIGCYPVHEDGAWHVRVVLRGADPARVASVAAELRVQL